MIAVWSDTKRQIRFLWLLDPIKRWPALPVLVLCIFDCVGHRVETVSDVETLDALPLPIGQAAQVDFNHRRSVLSPRRIPWRRRDRHPMRGTIRRDIARLPSRVRGHLYWMNYLPLASRHVPHDRQSPALCGDKDDGAVTRRVCNGVAPW